MAEASPDPKVFISYSWTSDEHVEWVVRLAERLVSDGVAVTIDQWDLKEGQDKHAFMEQMVSDPSITKVLAVCDKPYADKADGRRGGVGTETQIISPEVYTKAKQEKFIPLVREWNEDAVPRAPYLPVYFKNAIYLDFSDEEKFEERYDRLLRNIYGRPERQKPQLGQPPAHLFADNTTHVRTAGKLERLKDAVMRGRPHTQAMLQEYLETFRDSLEEFRVTFDRAETLPFDEIVVNSIKAFTPYRDNFIDFALFLANYLDNEDSYDRVFDFLETIIPYQSKPEHVNSWNEESFDNYRFLFYELFLYLIAALIKTKRYKAAARFMEAEYHYTDTLGGSRHAQGGVRVFNEFPRALEEFRNNRLQLNRVSIVADMMLERATHSKIKFSDIFQADFLLFFREYFPEKGASSGWYPRCMPYAQRGGTGAIAPYRELTAKRSRQPLISPISAALGPRLLP